MAADVSIPPKRPVSAWAIAMLVSFTFLMSSAMLWLFITISNSPLLSSSPPSATQRPLDALPGNRPKLSLKADSSFLLAIFSDLHYGEEENGWGIDQDVNSSLVMRSVLSRESPDLVVINGDLITGENTFKENASDYVHQIFSPLVDAHVPWASTYGNHDSKFNLSRLSTYSAETTFPLSYTQRMNPKLPGITNYYLLIHLPAGGRPVAVLWFFDSRGGASYQHEPADKDDIPNWVAPETASWFKETSSRLREQYGSLPSLAFVHIPPHVFLSAQKSGIDSARFPGVNDDEPLSIQGEGADDQAFVDAILGEKGLHSIYVGHDHGNSWCARWPEEDRFRARRRHENEAEGPILCFAKHSGYGGYGDWNRGARVVRLSFHDDNDDGDFNEDGEMEVESWVRMEDGDVVTRVSLNDTYGLDRYPTDNGE